VFFTIYTILLMVSGLMLTGMGVRLRNMGTGRRVLNILIGVAFLGYGFYLQFLFQGGAYHVFLYVFVLPVILAVRTLKANNAARIARRATAWQQHAAYPASPYHVPPFGAAPSGIAPFGAGGQYGGGPATGRPAQQTYLRAPYPDQHRT